MPQVQIKQIDGLQTSLDSKKEFNGFEAQSPVAGSTLAMNGGNFEISGTYSIWVGGVKFDKSGSPADSVAIATDLTLHFVYYDTAGVLQVSTTPWNLLDDNAPIATVYKDGTNYSVTDERHYYDRDRAYHRWAHYTIGARYLSGLTGVFTGTTLSVVQGVTADEDLWRDTGGTETTCVIWYRNSGLTTMRLESITPSTTPYKVVDPGVDDALVYDNAGTLTAVVNNRYVNSYVYASGDVDNPIAVLIGQEQHQNITGARNEAFPQILLDTAEIKLLYRVTYQNVGGTPTYIEAEDFRLVSTGPAVDAGSLNHAALTGRDAPNQHPSLAIAMDVVGAPTYDSLKDWFDTVQSAGVISGGAVTDAGTHTVNIAAGTGIIKATDSPAGESLFFDWAADNGVDISSDEDMNWVYVDYNGGTPIIGVTNNPASLTGQSVVLLSSVYRKGDNIWLNSVPQYASDFAQLVQAKDFTLHGAARIAGMVSTETGTRYLAITAGQCWVGLKRLFTSTFDTTPTGDTFTRWLNTSGGWVISSQAQVNNANYNDVTQGDGLGVLGSNKWGVRWLYMQPNGGDTIHMIWGRESHSSIAAAETEGVPNDLPELLTSSLTILIARIIVQEGATNLVSVDEAFGEIFSFASVANHNQLSSLQGGAADEYYHLTSAEHGRFPGAGATWSFDVATTDADPGAKEFRLNNATQASATFIYASDIAESGVDMRTLLLRLGVDDRIYVQQSDDVTRYHLFKVTGDAVGATDYVKIPVTSDSSGANLQDTKKCPWLIMFSGGGGAGDTLPIVDTTAVVKGSVDPTKLVRIEADGLTTDTTRVLTMPDANITPDDAGDSRTPTAHKDSHKSAGGDAFASTDLLEAIVKRLQESSGPTTLLMGAVADGKFLKRIGTAIIGVDSAGAVARKVYDFGGDNFDIANNSDWDVDSPASIIADPTHGALVVAAFVDDPETGVGGEIYVPTGATSLLLNFSHRAASSQTGGQTVDYRFRFRKITDGAIIGNWVVIDMPEMTIPGTDVNYHDEVRELVLSVIGMDAGAHYQFELTRYTDGTDSVLGDVYLRTLRIETKFVGINWIPADVLRSISGSDWSGGVSAVNAPIAADSNNAALKVRLHADATEEGSGFSKYVPIGIAKLKLHLVSRGEAAGGGGVAVTLHYRKITDGAAIGSWVQYDLPTDISLPANEFWQEDEWEIDLAGLATPIIPGAQYQWQLTRNSVDDAGDTLVGDWALLKLGTEFF